MSEMTIQQRLRELADTLNDLATTPTTGEPCEGGCGKRLERWIVYKHDGSTRHDVTEIDPHHPTRDYVFGPTARGVSHTPQRCRALRDGSTDT